MHGFYATPGGGMAYTRARGGMFFFFVKASGWKLIPGIWEHGYVVPFSCLLSDSPEGLYGFDLILVYRPTKGRLQSGRRGHSMTQEAAVKAARGGVWGFGVGFRFFFTGSVRGTGGCIPLELRCVPCWFHLKTIGYIPLAGFLNHRKHCFPVHCTLVFASPFNGASGLLLLSLLYFSSRLFCGVPTAKTQDNTTLGRISYQ